MFSLLSLYISLKVNSVCSLFDFVIVSFFYFAGILVSWNIFFNIFFFVRVIDSRRDFDRRDYTSSCEVLDLQPCGARRVVGC